MKSLINKVEMAIRLIDDGEISQIQFSEAHVNMNCIIDMKSGLGYVLRLHLGWIGEKPSDEKISNIFNRQKFVNTLLISELGLPAPRTLLIDNTKDVFDDVFMIEEKMKGTLGERLLGWLSMPEQKSLLVKTGQALRIIHSKSYIKSGLLGGDGVQNDQTEYTSLSLFQEKLNRDLQTLEKRGYLKKKTINQLKSLYENNLDVLANEYKKNVLIHSDYNLRNILFSFENGTDQISVSGILDTEGACVGSPIQDFMSIELWSFLRRKWLTSIVPASTMRSWLFEGYESEPNSTAYKLIYLQKRLSTELLDIGYLDEGFVLELNNKNLSNDLQWIVLP